MNIHLEGLEFECSAVRAPSGQDPYDDWLTCAVRVRVPNFAGSFEWQVMVGEIREFADSLEAANRNLGTETVVSLDCAEPNVSLEITLNPLGQIEGKYVFRGPLTGFEPRLSGEFSADQTFIPKIVAGFRELLAPVAGV